MHSSLHQVQTEQLQQFLAQSRDPVFLLVGSTGSGKTHLIQHYLRGYAHTSGKFVIGKSTFQPYSSLIQAMRKVLCQLITLPEAAFKSWCLYLQREILFTQLKAALPEISSFEAHSERQSATGSDERLNLTRAFESAFIQLWEAIARAPSPAIDLIWLDDVQWIDRASLELLEKLFKNKLPLKWILSGRELSSLDNLLSRQRFSPSVNSLNPLTKDEVQLYLQESLNSTAAETTGISELFHTLSQGSPLALSLSVKALLNEQKIVKQGEWIYTGQLTEKVLSQNSGWHELMQYQWAQLSASVQALLQQAAVLGAKFSQQTLAYLIRSEQFPADWQTCLDQGFFSELATEYQFYHDRLYEWVKSTLTSAQAQALQLSTAQQLLAYKDPLPLSLLVEQLNPIAQALTASEQKQRIILNLQWSREMLRQGTQQEVGKLLDSIEAYLLATDPEFIDYQTLRASQAYLNDQIQTAEGILLTLKQDLSEQTLEAQLLLIRIYTQHNRYEDAVMLSLELLNKLGLAIQTDASQVEALFAKVFDKLAHSSAADLVAMGQCPADASFNAQMQVLSIAAPALFNYSPNLFGICIAHALDKVLQGQGAQNVPTIYISGTVLATQAGNIIQAAKLAEAAETLAKTRQQDSELAFVYCIMGDFVMPWTHTYVQARQYFRLAWSHALHSGNLQFMGYTAVFRGANLFVSAYPLNDLSQNILPELIAFNERTQNYSPLDGLNSYFLLSQKLIDPEFDPTRESIFVEDLIARNSMADLSRYHTFNAFVELIFGNEALALDLLEQSELFIYLPASIVRSWYILLRDILSWRLQRSPQSLPQDVLAFDLEALAQINPANFESLYFLWKAENPAHAAEKMQSYHQALESARTQQLWHWEGFILESMAHLHLKQNLPILAQQSLLESISAYEKWGAQAKVEQLLPQLRPHYLQKYHSRQAVSSHQMLDFLTLTADFARKHSAQDIHSQILKPLRTYTQAAYAQLLLKSTEQGHWQSVSITPPASAQTLPSTLLLNYVERTHQAIRFPEQQEIFNHSQLELPPGSHVLLPLVFQQELVGIIYFFHPAEDHPFDLRHDRLLNALGGYIAGALHNLQSYQNLEALIAVRTRALKTANTQLSTLLDERQHVLSIAAHDLKHPLGTLQLGLSMLEQLGDSLSPAKKDSAFKNLYLTLEDMNKNTERLLITERLRSKPLAAQLQYLIIKDLIRSLQAYHWKAEQKQQTLIVDYQGDNHQGFETDPTLLKTILENLLDNAIKFSPFQSKVWLKIGLKETDVYIKVCDQGPGIPEAEHSNLFKKFSRLSPRPTAGESSNGLGLFIVQRFAESLNGIVSLHSSNQGTCFTLHLPDVIKPHTKLSKSS